MSKRKLRGFDFERLEDRRLLAADFGLQMAVCCHMLPAETCQVASVEVEDGIVESEFEEPVVVVAEAATEVEEADLSAESLDQSNCETDESPEVSPVGSEEIPPVAVDVTEALESEPEAVGCDAEANVDGETDVAVELDGEVAAIDSPESDGVVEADCEMDAAIDSDIDVTAEVGTDAEIVATAETGSEADVAAEADADVQAQIEAGEQELMASELRDPVLGTSGYFGEIDAVTPIKSMTFTPSDSGTIDVVVASSFGDSETRLEITDSDGELIAGSMTEDLSGFQRLTFDAVENCTYQVSVSSDETGEGYFMVTVEFKEHAEPLPVDIHSDQIGELATELNVSEGAVAIESELETPEDCDAFRFTASDDGEMVLGMTAASDEHESNAIVSVFDPFGELVVSGSTNEEVSIRFDTLSGVEYQVLVDSQNDIPTRFALNGILTPNVVEPVDWLDESLLSDDALLEDELADVLVDDIDDCFDGEADEVALVDEVFESLGEDLAVENEPLRSRFGGHHRGH